ncbi:MAG TPA: FkbM family methyltransferase [Flavitalea sp.]|nr:FkbM family methyltransferase [Flavitalea sp.]
MCSIQTLSSILQAFPSFKGKRRLGRSIMKISGVSDSVNIQIATKAGKFLLPNLKDMISIDLFINGYYEKGLIKLLIKKIPANGIFIDVGANIGSISIPLAKMRPDIKIISVEASPWIFHNLKMNVKLNKLTNISTINYAVFSESGKIVPMYAPTELFGKGSLKAVYTKNAEMVETISIDDLKKRLNLGLVDFIKVDVEGFEASVFNGMSQVIVSDKPKIVFEFSEWAEVTAGFNPCEAQSVILSKNYKIQQMDDNFNPIGYPSTSVHKVKNANLFASI